MIDFIVEVVLDICSLLDISEVPQRWRLMLILRWFDFDFDWLVDLSIDRLIVDFNWIQSSVLQTVWILVLNLFSDAEPSQR